MADDLHGLVSNALNAAKLGYGTIEVIAAPRRFGVIVEDVAARSEDKVIERKGPSVKAAFDENQQPTKALLGFCRGLGIEPDALSVQETEKGAWVVYQGTESGVVAQELLGTLMLDAIHALPLAKPMRWGSRRDAFPRPVHWIVSMLDTEIVPLELFGLHAGRRTFGHRFHAPDPIDLAGAADYRDAMQHAYVVPSLETRKDQCWARIQAVATQHQLHVDPDLELLEEIACLVEWPVALCGQFEDTFLNVPEIALIAAMRGHQKYFHTRNQSTKTLSNHFITVSNIQSEQPNEVILGNQRVIRARLSDAAFFFDTDCQKPLITRRPALDSITFHPMLGSLGEKTSRISSLVQSMAAALGMSVERAARAAELSRCDLVSEMVLEFDELQGAIGSIYAKRDGEHQEVAEAIADIYAPAGIQDDIPQTELGCILALADKLDTLTGLFAAKQPPTGSKDPFALRRATIGVLRINEHPNLQLDLLPWIEQALESQPVDTDHSTLQAVIQFIQDRERVRLTDRGIKHDAIQAAQKAHALKTVTVEKVSHTLHRWRSNQEFAAVVEGNKRATKLLNTNSEAVPAIDPALFQDGCEGDLFRTLENAHAAVTEHVSRETFDQALETIVGLKKPIDTFFESVMVNVDDETLRMNRYALLQKIRSVVLQVADISLIQY
jgi:glycyl-tRNA synthetase beta chain